MLHALALMMAVQSVFGECNWYSNNQFYVPVDWCLNIKLPNNTMSYKYACGDDGETIALWVWEGMDCMTSADNENVNVTELVGGDFYCGGTTEPAECAVAWRTYTNSDNPGDVEADCDQTEWYVESATVVDVCQNSVQSDDENADLGIDNAFNQSESDLVIGLSGVTTNETSLISDLVGEGTVDVEVASLQFTCMEMVSDPDSYKIEYTYTTGDDCTVDADEGSVDFVIKEGCTGDDGTGFFTEVTWCPAMVTTAIPLETTLPGGDDGAAYGRALCMPLVALSLVISLIFV